MSRRPTQRQVVERLLRERGPAGVGARELIYEHGITRTASIVHLLRQEGWQIDTAPGHGTGDLAVYVLASAPARPRVAPPPAPEPLGAGEPISWEELGAAFARGERHVRVRP